jgi:hypothetical protein
MRRLIFIGVCSLVLLAIPPQTAAAQDTGSDAPATESGFELQQNYPNPFNPSTRIPFTLRPSLFEDGQPVRVTMRIFNVLQQLVAFPTAVNHPMGNGSPVNELVYETPGQKEAFWDGRDTNGRQVASGVYYLQVIVKGKRRIMTMIVSK